MPKSLNLRWDLKRLDDTALAERLERAWADHNSARVFDRPEFAFRGPIRHPRLYRFYRLFGSGLDGPWQFILPLFWLFSSKRVARSIHLDTASDPYAALCEIRDVNDEIERRMRKRKKAGG